MKRRSSLSLRDQAIEGKDFFVIQAEKDGIKVNNHYFIHVTVEASAQYLCEQKEGRWKISFDSPQDPIDLASLRRDLALSALLADASQALTGFTNLDGASVGQTTGSGSSATEHCPQCGGDLKIIAAIEEPAVIVKILTHLGLPARAPPRLPARPLPLFQAA